MGLDMYLFAKKYCSEFDRHPDYDMKLKIKRTTEEFGLNWIMADNSRSLELMVQAVYWRKANAIHQWFVENVQDGEDHCRLTFVPDHKLTELRDLCRTAIDTQDSSLLVPQEGFFFGSTEVNEHYWEDLRYTRDKLTEIIEDPRAAELSFYYQSSW